MMTKTVDQIEEQVAKMPSNEEAIDYVESRMDVDMIADYLEDNQYMDREALLYCLQDDIQAEARDKGSSQDVRALAQKSQDVDTETALIYDVSLGYLEATPMTQDAIIDMVDNLAEDED